MRCKSRYSNGRPKVGKLFASPSIEPLHNVRSASVTATGILIAGAGAGSMLSNLLRFVDPAVVSTLGFCGGEASVFFCDATLRFLAAVYADFWNNVSLNVTLACDRSVYLHNTSLLDF